MEDQNTPSPVENKFLKALSIVLRGVLGGIVGGGMAGLVLGVVHGLFEVSHYARIHSATFPSNHLIPYLVSDFFWTIESDIVDFGIPVGLIIGISTGIFAAGFRHHNPRLLWWLVSSWVGVMAGFGPPLVFIYSWVNEAFLGITFLTLIASWMAYTFTIQKIKKEALEEVSESDTTLAFVLNFLLVFIMNFVYFVLLMGPS